jgi:hypothetical protein
MIPDPDEATANYADEFLRFRTWYAFESEVRCGKIDEDGADGDDEGEMNVPLMQALTMYRSQHLSDDEYKYDFSDVLDYPIDEYAIILDSLADNEDIDEAYDDRDEI